MSNLIWWESSDGDPRVVTRNSDGGTTGWTVEQAKELHGALGEILGFNPPATPPAVSTAH